MFSKLTKCKSCKKEIAKDAKRCPFCGGKQGSLLESIFGWIFIIIIVGGLVKFCSNENSQKDTKKTTNQEQVLTISDSETPTTNNAEDKPIINEDNAEKELKTLGTTNVEDAPKALTADEKAKLKHEKFINSLSDNDKAEILEKAELYIKYGYVYKITRNTDYPRVYVTDEFKELPYEYKEKLMANLMVMYYYLNYKSTNMFIKDYKNNKELGTYSIQNGLSIS